MFRVLLRHVPSARAGFKLFRASVRRSSEFVHEVKPQPLWKPITFSLGFTGGVFVGAAGFEIYERTHHPERDRWNRLQSALRSIGVELGNPASSRSSFSVFWTRLREGRPLAAIREQWIALSPSQKTLLSIIAANAVVFVAWRVPSAHAFLTRYFLHTPSSAPVSLLLSMFSHIGVLHFAFNMYALWSFGRLVHDSLGREQFLALYASAGVLSSLASHLLRRGGSYSSLGASGALYAMLAVTAVLRPDAGIGLVFLPFSTEIGTALPVLLAIETAVALLYRRSPLDHAAHLAGAAWGYAYMLGVKPHTWDRRDELARLLQGRPEA
jgi:rhomboid-like protein